MPLPVFPLMWKWLIIDARSEMRKAGDGCTGLSPGDSLLDTSTQWDQKKACTFTRSISRTLNCWPGWTPSTFKSSRTDRAKQTTARAEDFMDEEDLAELRDSQTLVLQNEEVDIAGRYAGDLASKSLDVENEQEYV